MSGIDSSILQGERSSTGTSTPQTNRSGEPTSTSTSSSASDVEKFGAPVGPPPGLQPEDFPDGGKDAWLCILGGWCGMFCAFGLSNCTGVFLDYYVNGPLASYGSSSVSWIVSTQVFVMSGTTALWGFLYDCHGPRWLLVGGTLTYVFGLVMMSLCTRFWQFFLAHSIVAGAGSGAVFNTCIATIPTWFRRRRATALGIIASGSSLGGVVLPIAIAQLTARAGFPWALRAVALVLLALCGTACLTVRSRLAPQPHPFVWAAYTRPLREPPFALAVTGSFFFLLGMYLPFNYLVLAAEAAGLAPGLLRYLFSILNAASTLGRIAPGLLTDRVGSFNTVTLIVLLASGLTLGLWLPSSLSSTSPSPSQGHHPGSAAGAVVAFSALFGFASGGFVSLATACIVQISDVREIGIRTGTAWSLQAFGSLLGSPIGGAILANMRGRYLGLQFFSGLSMLLGAVFYFLARVAQVGPRPLVKC